MLHPSTDIIMNAQQFFAADQSEANLVKLLHAVSVMLQEGAEVLIPTAADAPEGQLLLQTQTTESGLEYMTAYSSKEAYEQGKPCATLSVVRWSITLKLSSKWMALRVLSLTLLPLLPSIFKTG